MPAKRLAYTTPDQKKVDTTRIQAKPCPLTNMIKATIRTVLNSMGFDIVRLAANYSKEELSIIQHIKAFTATGPGRIVGLVDAVKYITANRIEGAIVECGVWRGGSVMAALLTLIKCGDTSRSAYLYDTFEGMSAPTARDISFDGISAEAALATSPKRESKTNIWCLAGLDMVRHNVCSTGYPTDKLHFIKGKVEDTIPSVLPGKIAILRLDTDWYESTKHELTYLYPHLAPGGVLILDDYGHWQGARQAADEYFAENGLVPLLHRLDYTGRMMVKMPA